MLNITSKWQHNVTGLQYKKIGEHIGQRNTRIIDNKRHQVNINMPEVRFVHTRQTSDGEKKFESQNKYKVEQHWGPKY